MSEERRIVPRTQATRERELLTLDYHGREVKTRVLEEDRAAVRVERDDAWRAAVEKLRDSGCGCGCELDEYAHPYNAALDALLAAMEGA